MILQLRILLLLLLLSLFKSGYSGSISINGSKISFGEDISNAVEINENWRFAIGDDTSWAKPGFDFSKWDTLYLPFSIEELIPFHYKGNVWIRTTFRVNEKYLHQPLSILVEQFGASEIYIDGKLIHHFGKVGNSIKTEEIFNPQSLPATFTIDSAGDHSIAIRYSNHSITSYENDESQLDAFDLQIVDPENALNTHKIKIFKQEILPSIAIGIFLTLGIMNFILFLFYKRDKANLLYSIFSITVAITFIVSALETGTGSASSSVLFDKLNIAFVLISNFFLLALVYSFIYNKTPKRLWVILILTLVALVLIIILCDIAKIFQSVLNIYCVVDVIIAVTKAYFRKYDPQKKIRKRVWIILLSLVAIAVIFIFINKLVTALIFGLLVLLIVLPIAGIVFIVPIYMTIRHAKSFATTNKSLEEQLIQVKELSAKTIEQEKEKKRILETQNEMLEEQVQERTLELAQKNLEITDSINYARRIQKAILTTKEEINETLKQSFVLFKPKDIVSGDFYFYAKKDNTVLFAAADCTGHGVPGALMSMIGSEKLMGAVAESTQPAAILKIINKGIKSSLRQSEHEESTKDGMDIALVAINLETNMISYSGANRPIWIIKNESKEVEEIKATKKAIAGFTSDEQEFEQHEIKLNKGDAFYLFTDGYADQFGSTGKKLMTKKFREILISIQHLPMPEQEKYLDNFIEDWKKNVEQVDDILVIGVRIN